MNKTQLIVIGNGMVGYKFLEVFTRKDTSKRYHITTFCEETRPAYDRVHLSEYFAGKSAEDLSLAPLEWYWDRGINLRLEDAVISIDREQKTVTSRQGAVLSYDILIMATGSSPFVPPLQGIDKKGVFVYRTIDDLEAISSHGRHCKSAAVIGGGLLGLEAAKALLDMNLEAHVLEFAPRLMPRQIDQKGSDLLVAKIEALGAKVHMNCSTREIRGDEFVKDLLFSDGEALPVDMVVVSAGIRPRDELARQCGLKVGERGGIIVTRELQSSDPNIYAIGECALFNSMIYGLVAPGYRMAEAVAEQIIGGSTVFEGADMSTKLKLMGVDVASIGNSTADGKDMRVTELMDSGRGIYKKLLIDKTTHVLLGAVLVGDADEYGQLLSLYLGGVPLPDRPETLISPHTEGSGMGVHTLPDEAQICSCENVCKGSIVAAIQDGNKTVPALKKCTKAGTGCGSCEKLLGDLIEYEMKKAGEVISTHLCEHFEYSRQDLLEIRLVSKFLNYISA